VDESTDNKLLRIFIGESDTHDGRPLYEAIVETLRREGLAGATVLRGIEGFGKSSRLHTAHVLRLSDDLPIVIECVDASSKIEAILPALDAMIGDGLVTLERVDVRLYRSRRGWSGRCSAVVWAGRQRQAEDRLFPVVHVIEAPSHEYRQAACDRQSHAHRVGHRHRVVAMVERLEHRPHP
jgi:hypothetical protein